MSLRYAALGLLVQQPGSGYDLLRRFEETMANVWPASQGQLYTELNRLAREGLIEVTTTGPRGRKVYAATDAGRSLLREWLRSSEPPPPVRSEALLQVFMMGQLPRAEARAWFDDSAAAAEETLHRLENLRDSLPWGDGDTFSRIALEFGLRFEAMQIEWARWARSELGDD